MMTILKSCSRESFFLIIAVIVTSFQKGRCTNELSTNEFYQK